MHGRIVASVEEISQEAFPFTRRVKTFVPASYDVATGFRPRLRDPGSCIIPLGYTVTLDEWKKQQIKEDDATS